MLQRFTACHWPNLILEKKIVLRNENERRCLGALYQDSGVRIYKHMVLTCQLMTYLYKVLYNYRSAERGNMRSHSIISAAMKSLAKWVVETNQAIFHT